VQQLSVYLKVRKLLYITLEFCLKFFAENIDNEVDSRKALQLLTDDDIAEIIKPVGARRKLASLRDWLNDVSP